MKRFEVQGLKELDAALGELKPATGRNVLRRVAFQALEPFDRDWRAKAAWSFGPNDYHMRETGGVGTKLSARQRRMHRKESEVEIHAGPGPDPAAVQQEFGNINHAAQPAVRPAWDANREGVLVTVRTELGVEIAKAAARAAKRALKAKG